MNSTQDLIDRADAYKAAAGIIEDTTVSYRVFRDTKKLAALRAGGDITLGRFNAAMAWFQENWPRGNEASPLDQIPIHHHTLGTDQPADKSGVAS